jgi:hypothetical protein
MNRLTSLALSALFLGAAGAALATGDFQVKAQILGDGQNNGKNDIRLDEVFFSQNEIYQTFIGPSAVTRLGTGSSSVNNGLRVVAGTNTSVSDKVMVLGSGSLKDDEVSNSVFRNQVRDAFNSRNLNWFFDSVVSDPHFCMDVCFQTNPLQNKVFVSERGTGGSNSKFTLQALNAHGQVIGNAVKVDPKNRVNTGLQGATYGSGTNPHPSGSQEISFYEFDVTDFGVNSISYLRITTPNVSLSSGQDIQPDFKVFGSAAPVPEPGTMLALGAGAAYFAARRRRSKKA